MNITVNNTVYNASYMKKIKIMSRLLRLSRLLSIMSCSRQRIHSCHSCLMFRCCDNTLNNWTSKARSDERKQIISQSTMTGLDILTFFGASLWVGFKLFHILSFKTPLFLVSESLCIAWLQIFFSLFFCPSFLSIFFLLIFFFYRNTIFKILKKNISCYWCIILLLGLLSAW